MDFVHKSWAGSQYYRSGRDCVCSPIYKLSSSSWADL